jgi:hypothetical protein
MNGRNRFSIVAMVLLGVACGGSQVDGEARVNAREAAHGEALSSGGSTATPAATTTAAPAACAPKSVAGFMPTWIPPGQQKGACTTAQIDDYYTACITQVGAPCDDFKAKSSSNAACAACILPAKDSKTLGPITETAGVFEQNLGGCVAVVDPMGVDCAKSLQAKEQCELAACEAACVVPNDPTSFDRYLQCAAQADQGDCKMLKEASNCFSDLGTSVNKCIGFSSFEAGVKGLAAIFCGP